MTVSDVLTARMLQSLKYPNPPAGIAVVLVNVGKSEPVAVHVDLHDGTDRVFHFDLGEVRYEAHGVSKTLVSPDASLQPKEPVDPYDIVIGDREAMDFMMNGKKINAIKRARELTLLGLKESKDLVEKICAERCW